MRLINDCKVSHAVSQSYEIKLQQQGANPRSAALQHVCTIIDNTQLHGALSDTNHFRSRGPLKQ